MKYMISLSVEYSINEGLEKSEISQRSIIGLKFLSSNLTMGVIIQHIQTSLLNLLGQAIEVMPSIAAAVVVLVLTNTAAKFVRRTISAATQQTVKSLSLRSLLVQIAFALTWAAGSLRACVIAFPAWRAADIISWLGLGSVGISFAFPDIFKYFLAEILLLLREPLQLGDRIIVEGFEGTVEKILLRSTQIISDRGERFIVPKAIVFTNSVRVLTTIPHRRTNLRLILACDTDLPEQWKPWLKLLPKLKAFCPKELQKLILQALTKVLDILFSAIGRCRNKHRC